MQLGIRIYVKFEENLICCDIWLLTFSAINGALEEAEFGSFHSGQDGVHSGIRLSGYLACRVIFSLKCLYQLRH